MFKHIVVPLDGSSLAENALPHAVAWAQFCSARVTLLRVLACEQDETRARATDPLEWQISKQSAQDYLDHLRQRLEAAGVAVDAVLLEGSPAATIIDFAMRAGVDLMVLTTHGKGGATDWALGSVCQKILMRSYLSTLLVHASEAPEAPEVLSGLRYRRLLVPLDGSLRAECALVPAMALVRAHGAQLFLAHVVQRPVMFERTPLLGTGYRLAARVRRRNHLAARKYLRQLRTQLMLDDLETDVLLGEDVIGSLHAFMRTQQIDLLVVSAHGHSGQNWRPFGSITGDLLESSPVPILLVQDLSPRDRVPTPAEAAADACLEASRMAENYAHVAPV
jgi:nucleotide-binding universal stress UspA family protein